MNAPTKTNQKGFTIIEVVLVLAIAALIFLMVFIALPALQRGQRDTQRRDDMSRAQSQLNSYQANSRGSLPSNSDTAWRTFRDNYLKANGDNFADPSTGGDYNFRRGPINANSSFDSVKGNIYYTIGSKCAGDGSSLSSGQGNRVVSLQMKLEGGGIACITNK